MPDADANLLSKTQLPALLFLCFWGQTDDRRPWDNQLQTEFEIVFHLDLVGFVGTDFKENRLSCFAHILLVTIVPVLPLCDCRVFAFVGSLPRICPSLSFFP